MTLWVFGDSFAEHFPGLKDQWMERVASEFKTNVSSFGLAASSLEYTYHKFNSNRHNIKPDDIIIVTLTSYSRRWFFKYYPGDLVKIYNQGSFDDYKETAKSPTGNIKEQEALQAYSESLVHNELQETYLLNFLYNLDYLTKKLNLKTIVMINLYDINQLMKDKRDLFSNLYFPDNMMLDIFLGEFTKDYMIDFTEATIDLRINHMVRSNHIVLADKIIDHIKNNKNIDLAQGFTRNIVSNKSLNDSKFINDELFYGYVNKLR